MKKVNYHESVLTHEVIDVLAHLKTQAQEKKVIDATLGTGGHTEALVKEGYFVLGIDLDPRMIEISRERLSLACPAPEQELGRYILTHGNFKNIDEIAQKNNINQIDAVLMDLGVSNLHLKDEERGFSFGNPEAQLDMRIDPSIQGLTAKDLLNVLREDQLRFLFERVLDPKDAKKIAQEIVMFRNGNKFQTMSDFLEVCESIKTKKGLNPATLPLLALRIAVNSELENLKEALPKAFSMLVSGGKMLVITFHSGEEKVVVGYMRNMERLKVARFEEKAVKAGVEELERNIKARSAKLFVLTKK